MTFSQFLHNIFYQGLESLGKYYSSYRGYVINNYDPDGLDRLQIIVPQVSMDTLPNWAYPKGQFSGDNYGLQILPQKGNMVWVEFDHGNPKFPIWNHGHYTKGQKPKEFGHPNVYGFKSPKGQIIVINDVEGVDKIIINHGRNKGLVKVIPLTEKINQIENKVNDLISSYLKHQHEVPPSTAPIATLPISTPATLMPLRVNMEQLEITKQDEIENPKIIH